MRTIFLMLSAVALTAFSEASAEGLGPFIPEAKGEQCVEPTQVMRERHWEFILHQRDETVHKGIRTARHSLKNCLECHVQPDEDGRHPRASEPTHFCTSCHVFAGIRIDCFECHADRPLEAYGAIPRHSRLSLGDVIRKRTGR